MSNYIEIDSTYRDRNLWPLPGNFEILLSQTGIKGKNDSIDAVSEAEPLTAWTQQALQITTTFGHATSKLEGIIQEPADGNIATSSDGTSFYILITSDLGLTYQPQAIENYIKGLIFFNKTQISYSRILYYKYLGFLKEEIKEGKNIFYWRCLITVAAVNFTFQYGDTFSISDPTDGTINTFPLIFVPNGKDENDAYANYLLYSEDFNKYYIINSYDSIHKILTVDATEDTDFFSTINFNIRKKPPNYPIFNAGSSTEVLSPAFPSPWPEVPNSTLDYIVVLLPDTLQNLTESLNFHLEPNYYKNYFLRLYPLGNLGALKATYTKLLISQSRKIIESGLQYIVEGEGDVYAYFKVYPPFNPNTFDKLIGDTEYALYSIEILDFSYDNATPYVYTDTLVQQESCYEFELINLVLPNYTLATGFGSKIAFYPYVYVLLTNISSSSTSFIKNILNTNNPHGKNMLFVMPIYDIQDPETTPFVRLTSCGMTQTIKFKPDESLYFTVILPNGDIFETTLPEYFSPSEPNQISQVSALFRYKRI